MNNAVARPAYLDTEQLKREQEEPLVEALSEWVSCQTLAFSLNDAAIDGLGLDASKLTRDLRTRIGMALSKLGCARVEKRSAKIRYWYIPPREQGGQI